MLVKVIRNDIEKWFDSNEVEVSLGKDSLVLNKNELYYEGNDWYILGEHHIGEEDVADSLIVFFRCMYIKRKYMNIRISGTGKLKIEIGINDIYSVDEYYSMAYKEEYLIRSIENDIVDFKLVSPEELDDITSGMDKISENGLWEDLNGSVCIVLNEYWKLNIDLIDNFMDDETYNYLIDNLYFTNKALDDFLENNLYCTEEALNELLNSEEDVTEMKLDIE